jgi:hypothetical protein
LPQQLILVPKPCFGTSSPEALLRKARLDAARSMVGYMLCGICAVRAKAMAFHLGKGPEGSRASRKKKVPKRELGHQERGSLGTRKDPAVTPPGR